MGFSNKSGSDDFSDINITPLTDVFLILFLIMIVIAPVMQESALKVNPPASQNGAAISSGKQKVITIEIDESGMVAVNAKKISETPLEAKEVNPRVTERIEELLAKPEYKDAPVNIVADAETKQKFVVGAMDAAAGLGLKKMNIVTVSSH